MSDKLDEIILKGGDLVDVSVAHLGPSSRYRGGAHWTSSPVLPPLPALTNRVLYHENSVRYLMQFLRVPEFEEELDLDSDPLFDKDNSVNFYVRLFPKIPEELGEERREELREERNIEIHFNYLDGGNSIEVILKNYGHSIRFETWGVLIDGIRTAISLMNDDYKDSEAEESAKVAEVASVAKVASASPI